MWVQKQIRLKARSRGFHLVTDEIIQQLPELSNFRVGMMHIFIQHTSASLMRMQTGQRARILCHGAKFFFACKVSNVSAAPNPPLFAAD